MRYLLAMALAGYVVFMVAGGATVGSAASKLLSDRSASLDASVELATR